MEARVDDTSINDSELESKLVSSAEIKKLHIIMGVTPLTKVKFCPNANPDSRLVKDLSN